MDKVAEVYSLAGILLASELPIPELASRPRLPVPREAVPIRVGTVSWPLPGGTEIDADCWATPSEYLLRIPGVARYRVSEGAEIIESSLKRQVDFLRQLRTATV